MSCLFEFFGGYVKNKKWIAPSVLSANFARLGEECDRVIAAGADIIHLDVMDNHYVPNLTVGPMVCKSLRDYGITVPIDVHLMVDPVDDLIEAFAKAGATYISFHPEATRHLDRSVQLVRDLGCKPGLVLNPATSLEIAEPVLHKLDMLLLMTVNPGFGGQSLLPYVLDKVREARQRIDALAQPPRLQVDGGIKVHNIADLTRAGADTFVVGSEIFAADDHAGVIRQLRCAIDGA